MTPVVAAVVLILLSAFHVANAQSGHRAFAPGDAVPDFGVMDLAGQGRNRTDLHKEASPSGVIMLTFWCTSCHSCRDMEQQLDQLAGEHKGKAAIFAVDANAGETAEKVKAFLKIKGLKFPVLLDSGAQLADLFGVKVTTTTLIIDGKGVLRYRGQFGRGQQAFAEEALKAVLAGKEVARPSTKEFG